MWQVALTAMFLSVARIHGEVQVSLNGQSVGSFVGTRYSDFIGGFEEECTINAPATILAPGENPCHRYSIQQSLTGKAVILSFLINDFGCFEETAYGNLEALGAVAVLNTDPQPAGATLNRINWGKEANEGEIPLLDLGLEFFGGVFLRAAESGEEIEVSIEGCADDNRYEVCINIVQTILNALSFISLLPSAIISLSALRDIKRTKGTAPRVFILRFILGTCIFFTFGTVTNITSFDGFSMFGAYPMGFRGIIISIFSLTAFYVTLLTIYYWSYLASKCFKSHETYGNSFWKNMWINNRKQGFFSRAEFKFINFVIFVSFITFLSVLLQENPDFVDLIRVYVYADLVLLPLLLAAHYNFVAKATKVIKETSGKNEKIQKGNSLSNKMSEIIENFTGKGLQRHLRENESAVTNAVSSSTMRLTLHLGFWVQIYTLLVVLLVLNFELLQVRVTSFGKLEDDPIMDSCNFVIPTIVAFYLRCLMLIPISQGIKGPKGIKESGTSTVPPYGNQVTLLTNRNQGSVFSTQPGTTKLRGVSIPEP